MPKATIKLSGGVIVTVEGSASEVADIVARFRVEHIKKQVSKENETKKVQKKRAASSDLIIELREAGFFNKPKGLGEIAKALEEKGHLYPLTSLSGVMLDLVRAKQLGRKKTGKKWVYGK